MGYELRMPAPFSIGWADQISNGEDTVNLMKLLFLGESWLGSCARSLREAMVRIHDIRIDDVNEDAWFRNPENRLLRIANRLTKAAYQREFNAAVQQRVREFRPFAVVVYKGSYVNNELLDSIKREGVRTVNVYPDYSPHNQGRLIKQVLGSYDLVISTKVYHPSLWATTYGYKNRCVFVPQGYDPTLHLYGSAPSSFKFDVVLIATWRREYGRLMKEFAECLHDSSVTVAVGGNGWEDEFRRFPSHWVRLGARAGHTYVSALRLGRIAVAPLTREVIVDGSYQPGDVDTTRTYELAAAHCFFIHRRTEYAQALYDESSEVPMFDDGKELAERVMHFLPRPDERSSMASAAHRRAVPAYSIENRAIEVVEAIRGLS